ncbi:MAG: helix-hairpin-helix domain-containing protein [Campylobacterales bacterium]|nr:helix-hairpin-helix domain-containing protein [Campylobacterales bacterium]
MLKFILTFLIFVSVAFGAVNINRANSAQLQSIHGIGPTKASEIIKYRKAHGGFKSVNELMNVKGIGPKTVAKIRKQVSIR